MYTKTTAIVMEVVRKTIATKAELTEATQDPGEFRAYIATFDVDRVGDRIAPGALTNAEAFVRDGFIAVSHDWRAIPVASVLEVGEDDKGIWVHARFHSHDEAQKVRAYMAERQAWGKSVKFSIGFYVLRDHVETQDDGTEVRVLDEIELVEASIVNVPANPNTELIELRYVEPSPNLRLHYLYLVRELLQLQLKEANPSEWRVGGARDLELLDDDSWDGDAAVAALREFCGGDPSDENFDWRTYRLGFVVYDSANPRLLKSYKLPFVKIRQGRLVASRRGLIAVRAALRGARGGVDLPRDVIREALEFVARYLGEQEGE